MKSIYDFILCHTPEFSVVSLCETLGVSTSAYYDYKNGKSYQDSAEKSKLKQEIKSIFEFHKKRYGSARILADLREKGFQIGLYRVRSIMKEEDLVAIQPKKFVPVTTQTHPHRRRSPNLLLNPLNWVDGPNQVIVGDITYLPVEASKGHYWLYMAVWTDLFSRRILGWCIDESMDESLIIRAFQKVLKTRDLDTDLIVHTDGGGQYSSNNFRAILDRMNFHQSMTRKDNHYDNAHIESLFSRFKTEVFEEGIFISLEDARFRTFEFIDGYYNTIRRHSGCGLISPDKFEEQYWSKFNNS